MQAIGNGQFKFRADDKGKPKAQDLRGPEKLKVLISQGPLNLKT